MKKAINALLCAAMAVLIFAASASGSIHHMIGSDLLQTLDNRLSDELMQRPRLPNRDIYVIGIDETSLRELGPWTSWKRDIMADMIDTLNSDPASKPAVIGIDVSYFNHTDPAADARLAQAAAQGGNVVVACEAVFSDVLMYDAKGLPYLKRMQISTLDYPYPELRAATTQGIINTLPESDGVIRNCIHKVSYDGQEIYGFAYEVYKKYAEHVGL
ncbi:MAG: CHASE2 domain-containing protein, partial [Angelakisella sp.]